MLSISVALIRFLQLLPMINVPRHCKNLAYLDVAYECVKALI